MVDFISEVQEELRKDDYNRWLKRYGPYALVGIAAVVAGTGFYEWNKSNKTKVASHTSAAYIAASKTASEGDVDQAIAKFMNLSQDSPAGYSGLALMRSAELELGKGNSAKSVALLDQAALTFDLPRHQQLAQIKAIYILAGQGAYADVSSRAAPIAVKGEPYEYLARELLGFAAKQSGDVSAAREQFSYLNNIPGVPGSIQQRAKQYLDLMSVAKAVPAAAPSEEPAATGTGTAPGVAPNTPTETEQ